MGVWLGDCCRRDFSVYTNGLNFKLCIRTSCDARSMPTTFSFTFRYLFEKFDVFIDTISQDIWRLEFRTLQRYGEKSVLFKHSCCYFVFKELFAVSRPASRQLQGACVHGFQAAWPCWWLLAHTTVATLETIHCRKWCLSHSQSNEMRLADPLGARSQRSSSWFWGVAAPGKEKDWTGKRERRGWGHCVQRIGG